MTVTARKALRDLQVAHVLLHEEKSAEHFRVLWVASVALCRAVGHALKKVDSVASDAASVAISNAYKSWGDDRDKHNVFWEFIDGERNSVLKQYEFSFMSGPVEGLLLPDGLLATLPDNFFCPMSVGRYSGVDCRDVLELAINWWQVQLDLIDMQLPPNNSFKPKPLRGSA